MILGLCLGVVSWVLFFFGHLVTMRRAAPANRARIDRILFLVGVLVVVPSSVGVAIAVLDHSAWTHGGWLMGVLWGVLVYVALFTLYMPFFYTVAASLSVRTIVLLSREPDFALPTPVLFGQFGSPALVAGRLVVMTQNGLLLQHGSEYQVTGKGRRIAKTFAVLKRFWRLGAGG